MHISICAILTTHSLGTCLISRTVYKSNKVSLLGSLLICLCALSGSCVCWKYYHICCTVRFADLQLFYMYFFVYLHSISSFIYILHLSHLVRNYVALTYVLLLWRKNRYCQVIPASILIPMDRLRSREGKTFAAYQTPIDKSERGWGATNIHSLVPLRLPTIRRLTRMPNEWLCLPGGSRN